jgi:hypothetical protein
LKSFSKMGTWVKRHGHQAIWLNHQDDHLIQVGHKAMTNFSVVTIRWSLVNTFLVV